MKKTIIKKLLTLITVTLIASIIPLTAFTEDRLIVKDATGTSDVFTVSDTGQVSFADKLGIGKVPETIIDITGANVSGRGLFYVSGTDHGFFTVDAPDSGVVGAGYAKDGTIKWVMGISSHSENYTFAEGNDINNRQRFVIGAGGNIGLGVSTPSYPLHLASGAHVTVGGTWVNASSRDYKDNIKELSTEEAIKALTELSPVKYNYKVDQREKHVGFIAEDVPDLVSTIDRKGLSSMDIVAVLTKVVQEQRQIIQDISTRLQALEESQF